MKLWGPAAEGREGAAAPGLGLACGGQEGAPESGGTRTAAAGGAGQAAPAS